MPGIHPAMVRMATSMEPHPLSYTARGGKITHKITRLIPMFDDLFDIKIVKVIK
jgi:hypothetical protein